MISSPTDATAKMRKPSGRSTAVNPYFAASIAESEHTIAFPNYQHDQKFFITFLMYTLVLGNLIVYLMKLKNLN